ncbi:hypothetical protein [Clostridium cochlearium]|uniref:hypothetical protein n=1 Tax=Clostridium cochlearium TaxID=1494 RepID=UPI00184DD92F|nr:hypothetical protein [Clostridium cochlearium]NMA57823.1 hypothetical protein [Clostridium cochlearium]
MGKILIVLTLALCIFIFLESYVKDVYFKEKKLYYYYVLKNILSMLVIAFIMVNRNYIKDIEGLGKFILICSMLIFFINGIRLYKNISFLRENKLL